MGALDFFQVKEELPEADRKWDRMWELWAKEGVPSPYEEIMNYEGEVNNGGHSQYFFNTANCGDLRAEVEVLLGVLPEVLRENLRVAYEAFAAQKDITDDDNDELFEACDDVFYENGSLLRGILWEFARGLEA